MKIDVKSIINEFEEKTNRNKGKKIIRLERQIPKTDLLKWLSAQRDFPKFYFKGRDKDDEAVAGVGAIRTIEVIIGNYGIETEKILSEVRGNNLRYYGGISFPNKKEEEEWRSFGKMKFILPEFELIIRDKKTFLACNIDVDNFSAFSFQERLEKTVFEGNAFDKISFKPLSVKYIPEFNDWEKTVENITDEINEGRYDKLVLARKQVYEFATKINPYLLLYILKQEISDRYAFLFQFERDSSFLGISMERLFKRTDREIKTEAIAGTIDRGKNKDTDRKKFNNLLSSTKDNFEQKFVEDFIENKLSILCNSYNKNEKKILELKESFHLITDFKGELKENISDMDIVEKLHPTPAVGGIPEKIAERLISEKESFSRGWYAGLVGYIGDKRTDFSVALRSALIYNNTVSLYSGVGLVKGSDADREWQEGGWKLRNFEEIFEKNGNQINT